MLVENDSGGLNFSVTLNNSSGGRLVMRGILVVGKIRVEGARSSTIFDRNPFYSFIIEKPSKILFYANKYI